MPSPMPITLRAFSAADETALGMLFADAQTQLWNAGPEPSGITEWWRRQNDRGPDGVTWAVADPADDRMLGTVAVFSIDRTQLTAEIGYRVLARERGRGVATSAVGAASAHAFTVLGVVRLELFHAVENLASCLVAQSVGFGYEGTLQSSWIYGDGRRHDEHLHARLNLPGGR